MAQFREQFPLEDYFSDKRIVALLCRKRLAVARLRRQQQFYSNAVGQVGQTVDRLPDVFTLLPPRRRWRRPLKARRIAAGSDAPSVTASHLTRQALATLRKTPQKYQWSRDLRAFIDSVRADALRWNQTIAYTPFDVKVIPKVQNNYHTKCRVLALYSLRNTVLASCFSAYFRNAIEPFLHPNCLAFRAAPSAKNGPPRHHDAADRLAHFRDSFSDARPLWATECDIQGFFDAVSHRVVVQEVDSFCGRHSIKLDPRMGNFLASFLAGYSYTGYASHRAKKFLKFKGVDKAKIADPVKALADQQITSTDVHGIPQGSALSCILANIVLTSADEAVGRITSSGGSFKREGIYLRYCDDIVIVDHDKERCQAAIKAYLETLRRLYLPFHEPKSIGGYSAAFWREKSKSPYLWSAQDSGIPWLAFVGYQLHRDGRMRIRKDSVAKEAQKQAESVRNVMSRVATLVNLKGKPELPRAISYKTMMHLVAIGVGYPAPRQCVPASNGVSWTRGFKALIGRPVELHALRRLDRSRAVHLRRLGATLRILENAERIQFPKSEEPDGEFRLQYAGRPFAYSKQFAPRIELSMAFTRRLARRAYSRILAGLDWLQLAVLRQA